MLGILLETTINLLPIITAETNQKLQEMRNKTDYYVNLLALQVFLSFIFIRHI